MTHKTLWTTLLTLLLLLTLQTSTATARDGSIEASISAPTEPQGLDRLAFMVGTWDVTSLKEDGKVDFKTTSTIRSILDGKALEERVIAHWGDQDWDVLILRTYDPFQDEYRMAALDNVGGLLDIYEGRFEDGQLRESNLDAGTYSESPEKGRFFFRSQLEHISDDHFVLRVDNSADTGKNWKPAGSFVYRRKP